MNQVKIQGYTKVEMLKAKICNKSQNLTKQINERCINDAMPTEEVIQ